MEKSVPPYTNEWQLVLLPPDSKTLLDEKKFHSKQYHRLGGKSCVKHRLTGGPSDTFVSLV